MSGQARSRGLNAVTLKEQRKNATDASVRRLLKAVTFLWLAAIVVGLTLHQDMTKEELRALKQTLPFVWFDRCLKTYGTLMPLAPFLARWMASALADRRKQKVTPALHFAEAGCLYLGISVGRVFIYILHVIGVLHLILSLFAPVHAGERKNSELMSDHLFLGASLTAILTTECVLAYRELIVACKRQRAEIARVAFLGFAVVVSALLCLGTTMDMFYTARYFHGPWEILSTMFFGYMLFQWPLWYWLLSQ